MPHDNPSPSREIVHYFQAREPWPPDPSAFASSDDVKEYFSRCFCSCFMLPPTSEYIRSLQFDFKGTGMDLYLADDQKLIEYVGNHPVGRSIFYGLKGSVYSILPVLQTLNLLGIRSCSWFNARSTERPRPVDENDVSEEAQDTSASARPRLPEGLRRRFTRDTAN